MFQRTQFFLLACFCLVFVSLHSQTYLPFPATGGKWKVYASDLNGNMSCSIWIFKNKIIGFRDDGDTSFQGHLWKKIRFDGEVNHYASGGTSIVTWPWPNPDTTFFIRSDSSYSKAWLYVDASTEKLCYDMNPGAGDTLRLEASFPLCLLSGFSARPFSTPGPDFITSVSFDTIGGVSRKVIHNRYSGSMENDSARNIEGIGTMVKGSEYWPNYCIDQFHQSYQYCENGQLMVDDIVQQGSNSLIPSHQCQNLVGREEAPSAHLAPKIVPNPGNERMTLLFEPAGTYRFDVFSSEGRSIFHGEGNTSQMNIETSTWASGLYFVQVEDGISRFLIRWEKF